MLKSRKLWILAVLQAFALIVSGYYLASLTAERDYLRQEYLTQQGVVQQAAIDIDALGSIATQYAAEIHALKREQRRMRLEAYIRQVNPEAPAEEIVGAVLRAEMETGIEATWLLAKIKQESYFDPDAVSRTGCRGLAQICRAAAQDVGLQEDQAFEVEANVLAGARYLRLLLDRTRGNLRRALVRYNGNDDPHFVQKIERHRERMLQVVG